MHLLTIVAFFAAVTGSPLELARDRQDRPALEKFASDAAGAAAKTPTSADAQYRSALAYCYLAEVAIEMKDLKGGRAAAEQGMKPAEKALALKPDNAEYYRVLGTL